MNKRSILIVEDDLDIRSTVRELLEEEHYEVFEAENGLKALDVLKTSGNPGLILLDMMMPVMDGQRFMDAKEQDGQIREVPVVVISAGTQVPRGAKRFIRKPFDFSELLQVAKQFCSA